MAGPFDVNPNSAAEISPIQLRGGYQPPTQTEIDVGAAVAGMAQAATGAFIETQKAAAVEDIRERSSVLRTALDALHNPAVQRQVFNKEAQKNPYYQKVVQEMRSLQSAVGDGRLSYDYAIERAETIIKTATDAMPGFTNELKAAAQDALGFEPSQRVVAQQLARLQQADKGNDSVSVWEQLKETEHPEVLKRLQLTQDLSPENIAATRSSVLESQMIEQDYQDAKNLASKGEITVTDLVSKAVTKGGEYQTQVLGLALQQMATGEGVDAASLANMVTQFYTGLRQEVNEASPPGSNPTAHYAAINRQEENTIKMIQDNDALKVAQRYVQLFDAKSGMKARDVPIFGEVYSLFNENPAMLEEMFKAIEAWKSSPDTFPLFLRTDKGQKFNMAATMAGFGDVVRHMRDGTKPEGAAALQKFEDTQAYLLSMNITAARTGAEAKTSFATMVDQSSSKNAMIFLTKPQKVRELAKFKEVHGDVINAQNNEKKALQMEFNQLRANGQIPAEGITVDTSGKVPRFLFNIDTAVRDDAGNVIGVDEQAAAKLQATGEWVRKANRLLNGMHYTSATGITPESVYAGPEQLAGFFNRTVQEQVEAAGLGDTGDKQVVMEYDPTTGTFVEVEQ